MAKKDKLLTELLASKAALELKVETQTSVLDDMERRLNDIDKTNRKLEEQRIKTTTEYSTMKTNLEDLQSRFNEIESENHELSSKNRSLDNELDSARCELAELRTKCAALADNENVSQNVAETLDEFRSAYRQLNDGKLVEAQEQASRLVLVV
jgi:predicted nuclease with TOPRIM domain